jgi:hypothetical protein
MARVVKNAAKWHRLTIKDRYGGDLVLMSRGHGIQISVWTASSHGRTGGFAYFTGRKTLRRLGLEILKASKIRHRAAGRARR